jgi:hypothetical protein
MTKGVMLFKGMKVGILPGGFKLSIDPDGDSNATLTLATAYNVLPIWLNIARHQLECASQAARGIKEAWGVNELNNRNLLLRELDPCLLVIVACGIALDSLYEQLRPFAKIEASQLESWKKNRTKRSVQIAEVIRRVFRLDSSTAKAFRENVDMIIKARDQAVHPTFQLKEACSRPDLEVAVDWKFATYRYDNAMVCYKSCAEMIVHLIEEKSGISEVDSEMARVSEALQELGVVKRNESQMGAGGGNA